MFFFFSPEIRFFKKGGEAHFLGDLGMPINSELIFFGQLGIFGIHVVFFWVDCAFSCKPFEDVDGIVQPLYLSRETPWFDCA